MTWRRLLVNLMSDRKEQWSDIVAATEPIASLDVEWNISEADDLKHHAAVTVWTKHYIYMASIINGRISASCSIRDPLPEYFNNATEPQPQVKQEPSL